jgi:1-deoxy-D-xylulose-5-phosphate synthase
VLNIGLSDDFIEHGTREECLQLARLDRAGIQQQVEEFLSKVPIGRESPDQNRQARA